MERCSVSVRHPGGAVVCLAGPIRKQGRFLGAIELRWPNTVQMKGLDSITLYMGRFLS